jgi:hypothetical protein
MDGSSFGLARDRTSVKPKRSCAIKTKKSKSHAYAGPSWFVKNPDAQILVYIAYYLVMTSEITDFAQTTLKTGLTENLARSPC